VAVGAYVFHRGRMLLMKRARPPLTYAPPGGHLEIHEDPIEGIRREMREETGLEITILGVAGAWFGSIDNGRPPLLGIDYFAETKSNAVTLSDEHVNFVWVSRDDIVTGRVETLDHWEYGYRPDALLQAFDDYNRLKSRETA
jgi:ADP-ribose pyrophosphatase YjhB (NUDIX family)